MTERDDANRTNVRNRTNGRWSSRDILQDLEHEAAALAALAERGDLKAERDLRALGRYLLTRLALRKTEADAERDAEDEQRKSDAAAGFED